MTLADVPLDVHFSLLARLLPIAFLLIITFFVIGTPSTPTRIPLSSRSRTQTTASPDPCDHSFADLPFTELLAHCFDDHFEVWNHLGDKGNTPPEKWRREHAADHAVILK